MTGDKEQPMEARKGLEQVGLGRREEDLLKRRRMDRGFSLRKEGETRKEKTNRKRKHHKTFFHSRIGR